LHATWQTWKLLALTPILTTIRRLAWWRTSSGVQGLPEGLQDALKPTLKGWLLDLKRRTAGELEEKLWRN
jgi:hypothetical protein